MLNRIALDEQPTREELENLTRQIQLYAKGEASQVKPDLLRSLYAKIPQNLYYNGPIYRGLKIQTEDAIKLFENNAFQGERKNQYNTIESWSYDLDIAVGFISSYVLGVVLQSHTEKKDVVMLWDENVAQYLHKFLDEDRATFGGIYHLAREREVMVEYKQDEAYRLCTDVYLIVLNSDIFKAEFKTDLHNVIMERLDDESKEYLNEYADVLSGHMKISCDVDGNLEIVSW